MSRHLDLRLRVHQEVEHGRPVDLAFAKILCCCPAAFLSAEGSDGRQTAADGRRPGGARVPGQRLSVGSLRYLDSYATAASLSVRARARARFQALYEIRGAGGQRK